MQNLQQNSPEAPKRFLSPARRRAVKAFSRVVVVVLMATILSCTGKNIIPNFSFKDPSGEPIKAVVRTTVPLAYATSVAMASVTGSKPTNADFIYNNCTTTPNGCAAAVIIYNNVPDWPLEYSSYGTIAVYGYWISSDQAILTVAFGDALNDAAGSSLYPVHHISVFPVMKTTTGYTIVYAKIDIDMQNGPVDPATLDQTQRDAQWQLMTNTHPSSSDASTNVSMDAWVINVDTAGTPTFSDDTYSISGGGQYVDVSSGSGSLLQLGMAAVTMGAGCADNPVEGLAVLNELESSSSNIVDAQALLSFGPACDGDFHVTLGTGNYLKANGDSLPLNLTSP